jgi:hypothetical protein
MLVSGYGYTESGKSSWVAPNYGLNADLIYTTGWSLVTLLRLNTPILILIERRIEILHMVTKDKP